MFKGGPGDYNRVMIWTSGSLWGAGWAYVRALVPVILLGGAYIFYKGRMLDALSFSDETAIGWGISIERERKKCCSVQLFLREHRLHLPEISALSDCLRRMQQKSCWKRTPGITASCVFDRCSHADFADTVAGNLFSPIEIPAGIAVSLVGVPYFVYLMWKE